MKIADFFVNIGIKGNATVKNALTEVKGSLSTARDASLGLKAGIFGAVVALEEITRRSVGAAVDLKNFAGATGLSTMELQKWGYWAEVNDIKAESMAETIKGLQSAQSALRLGQNVPAGAVYFGLNQANNPIEMIEEIRKKIRSLGNDQKEIGNARTMAATLGINSDMFAGFRIGTVGFKGLTAEMMLTEKEQEKLLKLNREWHMFWMSIKGITQKTIANDLAIPLSGFVDTMTSAVKGLSELIKGIKDMPNALNAVGLAIGGLAVVFAPYTAALAGVVYLLKEFHQFKETGRSDLTDMLGLTGKKLGPMSPEEHLQNTRDRLKEQQQGEYRKQLLDTLTLGAYSKFSGTNNAGKTGDTNHNWNVQIDGNLNDKTTVDKFLDQIKNAWAQLPSTNAVPSR